MKAKKIVIAPDSFKGTMSAPDVCRIAAEAIKEVIPDANIDLIPLADGGEGSAECIASACGGTMVNISASGPYFEKTACAYALLPDGTAVVEAATCDGLTLVGKNKSAADTTSYGVGEQIRAAIERGCGKISLCLGGTASNDGGCGMAAALGVKFFDKDGASFVPVGRTLEKISRIDASAAKKAAACAEICVLSDVDSPFYGEFGAARVFAAQKGANDGEIDMLDDGMRHLADVIKRDAGVDISSLRGAGAAGGIGGAAAAFLGAEIKSGIETILDVLNFDARIRGADLVITGEGKLDFQSVRGKVISGVAARAKKVGIPASALVGQTGQGFMAAHDIGILKIYPSFPAGTPLDTAKKNCKTALSAAAKRLAEDMI